MDVPPTEPGSYPFGPNNPLTPRLPAGTTPRILVPPVGYNLTPQPRLQPGVPLEVFPVLRKLSTFDVVRTPIERLKSSVRSLPYEVVARPEYKKQAESLAPKIDAARRWLEMPNPIDREEFDDWVGKVCDETLSCDNLSIVPRHTRRGDFAGLQVINGDTIKVLMDDRGGLPAWPNPAYQQIVYGYPETSMKSVFFSRRSGDGTDDELWYWPRNRRAITPYGMSEVEGVLVHINTAMQSSLYDLSWFTDGAVPQAFYAFSEPTSKPQRDEYQTDFEARQVGRTDRRAGRVMFVPPGDLHLFGDRQWAYDWGEYLWRVSCFRFGISPLPIMKNMGRNPSASLKEFETEHGVKPLANFICRILNRALRDELDSPEIMVQIEQHIEEDPQVVYARNIAYFAKGLRTYDQIRAEIGDEPVGEDWAQRPVLIGTDGVTAKFLDEALTAPEPTPPVSSSGGDAAAAGDDGEQGAPPAPTSPLSPAAKAFRDHAFERRAELARIRRALLKRAVDGKPVQPVTSSVLGAAEVERINRNLGVTS